MLTDYLFANPIITVPMAAQYLNITYPPAKKAIQKLIELGILKEQNNRERNRTFIAHEIRKILT